MEASEPTRGELIATLARVVQQLDEVICNTEGRWPGPHAGCIECTAGTVPDRLNTGLCAYHQGRDVLRRACR